MPRYKEEEYSLENALQNINIKFLQLYQEELKTYAQHPERLDIVEKIHSEWDKKYGLTPSGTDIRIEWSTAIYAHGDWERALVAKEVSKQPASVTPIDPRKNYPAEFRCDNGVYVRSLSELFIADWLYTNRIAFEYERKVFFQSSQQHALCDFYLSDYDVYIEFWGMEKDKQYIAYKQWKEPLYEKNGYKLISLNFQDLKVFRDNFSRKLKPYEKVK